MSTQCWHSLSHVYSSVCIRRSSSQSQKIFLMCELESMRPLTHGLSRCSAGTLIPSPWSLRAKLLPIHGRSLGILSDPTRPRSMPSPRPTSASARPRRLLPSRRGAPDTRVLNNNVHVLSRSLERVFAPFHSSLDLSRLTPHQLDAWHAREPQSTIFLVAVVLRAPGEPVTSRISEYNSLCSPIVESPPPGPTRLQSMCSELPATSAARAEPMAKLCIGATAPSVTIAPGHPR